ncbi:N,N dimethylarginine dimethylhydrolase, eukaryotic [Sulfidibacter corallicola]|uniref:Amidinotransferase n=1 Tax=Sulfidibacter corallicola TaxID=2818388 RepID=A0A8A4TVY2_SULCO|nr:arginine deiminase-related protein [Sulfidibacter corallicola]QTD53132.1 hypothetical protein J3U87_11780 [Sulfidibacter corallicola]
MVEVPPNTARLADTVLMVRPHDFDFNEQTGKDNEFQNRPQLATNSINAQAMTEFEAMVARLRQEGIEVLVLEKSENKWIKTPDAVFPNNWFSTEHDGTIVAYPMLTENRRAERRFEDVETLLDENGFYIRNLINVGRFTEKTYILEGTGSMVIDHANERVYAAESQRCHPHQFQNFVRLRGYREGVLFRTASSNGLPVYHTNVLMSIGEAFAVVCTEAIYDPTERALLLDTLGQTHEVIEISNYQMERHFCGNILQLRNHLDQRLIVMSQNAFEGFSDIQKQRLSAHGKLVPVDINTIESVGGGSARCMMAEVFSPRANHSRIAS